MDDGRPSTGIIPQSMTLTDRTAKGGRGTWNLIRAILGSAKRLLISVPIILVPVLLFFLFQEGKKALQSALPDPIRRSELTFDATFLLSDRFLEHLSGIASNWAVIVVLFFSVNFAGGWIGILGFATIVDAISKNRANIFENMRSVRLAQVAKFILSQIILYLCYLLVAGLLYLAVYYIYRRYELPYIHYAFVALVLLVPLHFGLSSMYLLILTLTTDLSHELRLIRTAIWPRNVAKLFSFYLIRVAIEAAIAAAVYFSLRMLISGSIAAVATGFAMLLIPYAFFRVSSALFKLALLSSDPVAHALVLRSLPGRSGLRAPSA